MMMRLKQLIATVCVALGGLVVAAPGLAADEISPDDWLVKMASAVQTTNYEGTVIRVQNGKSDTLKVVHVVTDGVIREKVVVQEGDGLEIIRNGNEVHCILPDKQTVRVEEWNDQSTLFSSLPSTDIQFGSEYDVSVVREERVAGRKTVLLAIRPHDHYRYGHRIWLDIATGFPLQTKLMRDDTQPQRKINRSVDSPWNSVALPSGFAVMSMHEEDLPGRDMPVVHILYSDGLANVSVFIEPANDKKFARRSRVGASNSYSVEYGGYQVTAVGEVPAATVEKIATSMQPN
jgi:sigma-E factor negative regulatory protein RseB